MFQSLCYLKSELCSTSYGVWQELKKADPIRCINELCTMDGLDKISQTLIPIFKALQLVSINRFETYLAVARGQRDLYQSTLLIPSLLKIIKKPSLSHVCTLFESLFKVGQVIVKYDVCKFDRYQEVASLLGQYSIFKYRMTSYWLLSPRDFFMFLSGACEISRLLGYYLIQASIRVVRPAASLTLQEEAVIEVKKRRDLLHLTYQIGKVSLAILRGISANWNGPAKLGLYILEIGTHTVSLIRVFIR